MAKSTNHCHHDNNITKSIQREYCCINHYDRMASILDIYDKSTKQIFISMLFSVVFCLDQRIQFFLELHGTLSHIDMSNMSDTSVGIDSSGRFTLWSRTYNYLQNPVHFLWGGGPNDFLNYSLHNTQNFLLKAWVDYGLLGLIAYLLFIKVLFLHFIIETIKRLHM